jgi:hypothetical protein
MLETPPLPNQLRSYQHPGLVSRLQQKLGVTSSEAEDLFSDVKYFLYDCHLSDVPLSPSERVDEGWHNFILFTKDYADFCHRNFGRFIHHVPLEDTATVGSCTGNYCRGCSHGKCKS